VRMMLVDLNLRGKIALVIGEGHELEARVQQFHDAGATVVTANTGSGEHLKFPKSVKVVKWTDRTKPEELIRRYDPYALVLATTNKQFASEVSRSVRRPHPLVYAVDMPEVNDFNMPAVAKLGDIRVAVSTSGISPAMASTLRKRIERIITTQDLEEVRLQERIRDMIRKRIHDGELRKRCIYKIIHNQRIRECLQDNKFEQAKKLAMKQVELYTKRVVN